MEHKFTDENFQTEVLEEKLPVLVDFYADWCGPCKMMAPIVKEFAEKYEGKCKIGKLNVDENPKAAARYRVMSIPTFLVFHGGEQKDILMGAVSKTDLESFLQQVMK